MEGKEVNRLKQLILLLFFVANIVVSSISVVNSDEFVKNNFPAMPVYFGVSSFARKLSDLVIVFGCSFSVSIIAHYNFSRHGKKGFKIFKALKSLLPAEEVRLNLWQLKKLQFKTRKLVKLCNYFQIFTNISINLIVAAPIFMIQNESKKQFFMILASQFFCTAMCMLCIHFFIPPLVHLYVVSHYFRFRIKQVKLLANVIESISLANPKSFKVSALKLLSTHNALCQEVAEYNKFWNLFYFFALLFMIPYNISLLYCLLFGNLKSHMIAGYSAIFTFSAAYIFIVGSLFANIAYRVFQSRKQLNRIMKNCNCLTVSTWLKIINSLERIGTRKVAFTCGGIYFVTYATVFKVIK